MSKQHYNTSDVDQEAPPPAYQETPPFNPNYTSSSSQSPPFNPHYQTPHTPETHQAIQPLYPQMPMPQSMPMPQPMPVPQVRYQTIDIPYSESTVSVRHQRQLAERRKFPLAAIFFLFGWFCPPLWVIGACCCAASRNEYESFWGKVNFIMVMAMIASSIIYSMIAMSRYM
ncbi:uncharacterized protein B0P05DRAFT_477061 [Gilbertella persicaria]|uniref:uncharacterized protein n=1 Tax=Gilbertella persicaria TaxID=101096 RepID=UPI00221EC6CC|nr:uncharacterized protein B0P05DRAFT_477061 [Gilbertella persicaria]KAI8062762.1 hypothetical protein B0P05DRAFT_477061 [Gilbertella persicaria]